MPPCSKFGSKGNPNVRPLWPHLAFDFDPTGKKDFPYIWPSSARESIEWKVCCSRTRQPSKAVTKSWLGHGRGLNDTAPTFPPIAGLIIQTSQRPICGKMGKSLFRIRKKSRKCRSLHDGAINQQKWSIFYEIFPAYIYIYLLAIFFRCAINISRIGSGDLVSQWVGHCVTFKSCLKVWFLSQFSTLF